MYCCFCSFSNLFSSPNKPSKKPLPIATVKYNAPTTNVQPVGDPNQAQRGKYNLGDKSKAYDFLQDDLWVGFYCVVNVSSCTMAWLFTEYDIARGILKFQCKIWEFRAKSYSVNGQAFMLLLLSCVLYQYYGYITIVGYIDHILLFLQSKK